jgi:pSer/pThr/pTyr-binding forkhead associated (FHA) protein
LRDDGATNGTTVNDQPVTGKGDIPLEPGSTIRLGQGTKLRFDLE